MRDAETASDRGLLDAAEVCTFGVTLGLIGSNIPVVKAGWGVTGRMTSAEDSFRQMRGDD